MVAGWYDVEPISEPIFLYIDNLYKYCYYAHRLSGGLSMRNFLIVTAGISFWLGLITFFVQVSLSLYVFFEFKNITSHTDYSAAILLLVISVAFRQIKMDYFPSR